MNMNMFPMTVTTPDGTVHRSCRVVADGRTCTVWRWDGSAFVVVVQADADGIDGTGPTWTLSVDDWSDSVVMARQDGCGCGHPLKSYTPTADDAAGARRLYTTPTDG